MPPLILATTSKYRIETFAYLGLPFESRGSNVDEYYEGRPTAPDELVQHLATLKATSVAKEFNTGIVIGLDSVGWFNGQILEKAKSREEAFTRLRLLSGNIHQYYTGMHMINVASGKTVTKHVVTQAELRALTDAEINNYLDQDPDFNTYAIGYDAERHYSASFIKTITGSYNNVIHGLPLETIVEMLPEVGYDL